MILVLLSACHEPSDPASEGFLYDVSSNDFEVLPLVDFEKNLFLSNLSTYSKEPFDQVIGAISSHHTLASALIHDLFTALPHDAFDHIVIMGPDHKSRHGLKILTTKKGWSTPFGVIPPHLEYHETLSQHPFVEINDNVLQREHSSTALIPFVAYYFPDVTVTCLALSSAMNQQESIDFGHFLTEMIQTDATLVIASLDFSHYLPVHVAYGKDAETYEAMVNHDYRKIMTFTNDHVDSPPTLVAFLTYLTNGQYSESHVLAHKNSFDIIPAENHNTTSYFMMIYTKGRGSDSE